MGEVLLDVNVLGAFLSAYDVVIPLNARCVDLVYQGRHLLLESETVRKSPGGWTSFPNTYNALQLQIEGCV